jgi:hypothetical protein
MFQTVAVLVPIVAIIFGALAPILIVWLILRARGERNRLVYETAVKLADKGQPVPPELFQNLNQRGSDLRRGLVLMLFGISLCIALYEVGTFWTFGLIPAFMGIGYLIVWQVERSQTKGS